MSAQLTTAGYVNSKLHRNDIPQAGKLTTIQRLDCGFTKIIADAYLSADNLYGMSTFFKYMKPADPSKGYGYEVIGMGFPKGEVKLSVGMHLISRIHDQFPIDKKTFNNRFSVRQTYTKNLWYLDTISDPTEFMAKQMKAFGGSINNFLGFMMYAIFRNLSGQGDQEQSEFCESTKIAEYEAFIADIFNPSTGKTNGYPFYQETLALENVEPINRAYKVTTNDLQDHITTIRQRLKTHLVSYSPTSSPVQHDLAPEVIASLSLKHKIREVVRDILRNCGKYKIDQTNQFNIAPHAITGSDLIVIMNKDDEAILEDGYPLILNTSAEGFTTKTLGVGQVIYVPYVARGEAYIIHKDAFQFIIDESEVGYQDYPEHRSSNMWARMSFTFDLIDLLPAVVLKKEG